MGIGNFFKDLLPLLSPQSLVKQFELSPEGVVIADISALVYHLGKCLPKEMGHRLLHMVPTKQMKGKFVFVSDNDKLPLPQKDLTRANRPRTERLHQRIIQLHDTCFELDNGIRLTEPLGATDVMISNRTALFAYLKDFLRRTRIADSEVLVQMHHDSDAPEADIAIAHRISEHKASFYLIRTDDADVPALLCCRFRQQLLEKEFNIVVDRGSNRPDRYVSVGQLAQDLERRRITNDMFLGLCFCAGTDFVFKQWLSAKVGTPQMIARLISKRHLLDTLNLREPQDFDTFVKELTMKAGDSRKPVPMKLKRMDTMVVPWDYIQFNFEYWLPQTPQAHPKPRLQPQSEEKDRAIPLLTLPSSCTEVPRASKARFLAPLSPILCSLEDSHLVALGNIDQ